MRMIGKKRPVGKAFIGIFRAIGMTPRSGRVQKDFAASAGLVISVIEWPHDH